MKHSAGMYKQNRKIQVLKYLIYKLRMLHGQEGKALLWAGGTGKVKTEEAVHDLGVEGRQSLRSSIEGSPH